MYIRRKGTDILMEAKLARDPDPWSVNKEYIFPDSYFVVQDPEKGELTFNIVSPEAKEYEVCSSDGQAICSLHDWGRSVLYQSDIERVNRNVTHQMDQFAAFAEAHKNGTLCVPSKIDPNLAVGFINPTLEQLGEFAIKYHVFDYYAKPGTEIAFDEKFAHKLSQIAETEYAIANRQSFAGYFTVIQGNDMLSVDYITQDYGIPPENLIIADVEQGDITLYAEEWICVELGQTCEIGEAHLYINDDYIFRIEGYWYEDEMQAALATMESSLEKVMGITRGPTGPEDPSDPNGTDDQSGTDGFSQVDD